MRIENGTRTAQVTARSAPRQGGEGQFQLGDLAAPQRQAPAASVSPPAGIEALLALQAVEDPLLARRKTVRRGSAMLDALAEAQADLLGGRIGEGRLNQMMALVTQARERVDPGLDALIDDIDLRVRVELAKHGRFPS